MGIPVKNKPRVAIHVTPEAVDIIKDIYLRAVRGEDQNVSVADQANVDTFERDAKIMGELERIFKDGRLDAVEARGLFDIAQKIAGNDHLIDAARARKLVSELNTFNVVRQLALEEFGGENKGVCENLDDKLMSVIDLSDSEFDRKMAELEEIATVASCDFECLLHEDKLRRGTMVASLEGIIKSLEKWETFAISRANIERKKETSVSNFYSPQNLYGYSTYIDPLSKTMSCNEMDSLYALARSIRSDVAGLKILMENLRNGYVRDDVLMVVEALRNLNMDYLLDRALNNSWSDQKRSGFTVDVDIHSYFVRKATQAGAFHLADEMLSEFTFSDEEVSRFKKYIPSGAYLLLEAGAATLVNDVLSADSILTFGVARKLATMMVVKGGALLMRTAERLKGASNLKYLSPGVPLLKVAGRSALGKVGAVTVNIASDVVKANAYVYSAHLVFGDNMGNGIGGNLYMFALGLNTGVIQGLEKVFQNLAKMTEAELVQWVKTSGSSPDQIRRLYALFSTGKTGHVPKLEKVLVEEERLLAKAEAMASMRGDVDRLFSELKDTIGRYKGDLPEDILQRVERAASNEDSRAALRSLEGFRREIDQRVEGTFVDGTRSRAYISLPNTGKRTGGGGAACVADDSVPLAARAAGKELSPILQRVRSLADHPPEVLTEGLVKEATGGRFDISPRIYKEMEIFYSTYSNKRSQFWKGLADYIDPNARGNWKAWQHRQGIPGADTRLPVYRLAIKGETELRIFAQENEGVFTIIHMEKRGQIR